MVLSKSSNSNTTLTISNKGVRADTLLLIILLFISFPCRAIHRDTLGAGSRTYFVQNLGQWEKPILFKSHTHNAVVYAEKNGLTITLRTPVADLGQYATPHPPMHRHVYRVRYLGASVDPQVSGQDINPADGYDNYYYGKDPSKWVSHLPHYSMVYYHDLYPGIDMDLRVAQHAMKTNYYVQPGASPSAIVMRYEGADKLYLSNSNLIIRTSVGDIVELKPYAYQETDTGRVEITVRYQVKGDEVRFHISSYDKSLPLIIDPILHFSTYTGSHADNWGTTATYDSHNNTYTAGLVWEQDGGYPVSVGAYDVTYNGNADIGIFKFDPSGSQRLFATFLGGSLADMPHSLFVNAFDELVVFGTTGSADFPVTPGAYDSSFNGGTLVDYEASNIIHFQNGSDIFVSRFNSDGTQLQASTYIGGSGNDGLNYRNSFSYREIMCGNDSLYFNYGDGARGELITDDVNNVYVGSTTFSVDFPTTSNAIQSLPMLKQNGVVFKLDYHLRNLLWSTYLGGNDNDAIYSIDVDTSYNVIVCGGTNSWNFPTTSNAYQRNFGGGTADGFVAKISYNGDRLLSSTFFGSNVYDQIYFVRTSKNNHVYLFGQTKASDSTMIFNAEYNVPGAGMLLAHLDPDLSSLEWSTVFGTPTGRPNLSPTAFACDICDRIYAAGWGRDYVNTCVNAWNTYGTAGMEVTSDAIQSTTDGQDFYIISLSNDASHVEFATFFGEIHDDSVGYSHGHDHVDGGTSRFDKFSTLYQSVCASCGGYNQFPTTENVWSRRNYSPNCNNAVFRLNVHDDYPVAQCLQPPVGCYPPYTVQFTNTGRGDSFFWDFGDGSTSTQASPSHTYTQSGTFRVMLVAVKSNGCKTSDTSFINVRVLDPEDHSAVAVSSCTHEPIHIGPRPLPGCSYQWITNGVSDPTIANPYVTESGDYILLITTVDNCTETDTFRVEYLDILDTLMLFSPTCPGGSDGRAVARLFPEAQADAEYYWDGFPGDSILPGLSANGVGHTLTVFSRGCTIEVPFIIQDPPALQYNISSNEVICGDDCDGWINVSYGYPNQPTRDTLLENLCEGTYTINFSDTAGCPYSATSTIVRDTLLRNMRIWSDNSEIYLSQSTRLHVTPVENATYAWNDPATLDHPDSHSPVATPVDTITVYTCRVTDSLGCSWNGSLAVHCTEVICGRPNIFIPNAFSPNGDGLNDQLCFRGKYVLEFHLAIYSRWGEKVFETNDINACWDGKYNGNWCMPGVYTYFCQVKCEAGFENIIKGDITLIR